MSYYNWLWVTPESFTHIHQSTFARIVGTSTSFHHWCKEKLEATVLVMNNTNQLLLSLAKNKWMKLDESLPSQGLFQKVKACMWFFRKRAKKKGAKNVKKGQNILKIWVKLYKIWNVLKKGRWLHVIIAHNKLLE